MAKASNTEILSVSSLKQTYNQRTVLDIDNLSFHFGKIYCIYGPNGSGKTTLFEILTLLKRPVSGTIFFKDMEVFPKGEGITELRSRVTMVQQNPLLFNTTVEKNVDYGLRIRKTAQPLRKKRVQECLSLVGLDGFQKRKARELSGGEMQRVAIARALSVKPDVVLLDEFSANIDRENIAITEEIIRTYNQNYGATILFITHYINQAYRLADEVIHLFNGRIVKPEIKNLFRGQITKTGAIGVFKNERVEFYIATEQEGRVTVAIPSEVISISNTPVKSSMRNCLQGRITNIIEQNNRIHLLVRAGELFEVKITRQSFYDMGLNVGVAVYLNFKATAVEVLS